MRPDTVQPARTGAVYSGVLDLIAPKDGTIDSIDVGGDGWMPVVVELLSGTKVVRGQTIEVPFQVAALDETKLLEVRIGYDGGVTAKRFDLSPNRFARQGRDRPILRVPSIGPLLFPSAEGGDGAPRGCDDQQIRVRGRFEYERAGRDFSVPPDGDFNDPGDVMPIDNSVPQDGDFTDPGDFAGVDNSVPPDGDSNDPLDIPQAIIGADGIWFQIMDDDDDGDEVMFESYTDINGYFDVTICWDDDGVLESGGPDIYIRFECDTGVVNVQDGNEPLEEDYSWSTEDDPWDNFTGNDLNFGAMRPTVGDDPVIHIHNSITRVHRFVLENNGDYVPEVDVLWPDESTRYNPFFEEIYVDPTQEWNEGTQSHEWGHHLFNHWLDLPDTDYCNGFCDDLFPNPCQPNEPCEDANGGHCVWCQENDVDAWNEGFSDWLGSVQLRNWQARYGIEPWTQVFRGTGNDDFRYTLESVRQCCTTFHDPWTTEGFVGALLRDIEDPLHDPGQTRCPQDSLALGSDEILSIVRNTQPIRVIEFIERFRLAYPNLEHDFRSTALSVSPVFASFQWPMPPIEITTATACDVVRVGQPITLSAQTNGSRYSLCMQWQHNSTDLVDGGRISGATTETLTIVDAVLEDAGNYALVIRSCDGSPNACGANATQSQTSALIPVHVFGGNGPGHRITGWGRNVDGSLGRGTTVPDSDVNPGDVINLNDASAVSAGYWNSIAVKTDGTAWVWGSLYLGNGTNQSSATPVQVNNLTDIVAVAAGSPVGNCLALDANGHVWSWGSNYQGLLGFPQPTGIALNPGQVNLDCVIDISMGNYHAAAVTNDGSLWMWGGNSNGELGQGITGGASNLPVRVTDLNNVVDVDCGGAHTLARLADGTLWACGWNNYGQLGDGTFQSRNRFVQVTGLVNVTSMAAGQLHSLARLSNGQAWAWGNNIDHTLGTGAAQTNIATPASVINVGAVRAVDAGYQLSVFVTADGTIWTCGSTFAGQLGRPNPTTTEGHLPAPVDTRVGAGVIVSAGTNFVMAIAPGARIVAPVADKLVAGCSPAQMSVTAVGEPPMNYQWGRIVAGLFVPLNESGGRYTGTTTSTMTIVHPEWIDSNLYQVQVLNASNQVVSNQATLSTPPMMNALSSAQDADWFSNERGNWAITNGTYAAGAPALYANSAYSCLICRRVISWSSWTW